MDSRIVYFSKGGKLSTSKQQLVYATQGQTHTLPLEDLMLIEADSTEMVLTTALFQQLATNQIPVLFNDAKHMPTGMFVPLTSHSRFQKVLRAQLNATQPLQKQLWAQLIKQKLVNQAAVLHTFGLPNAKLMHLTKTVRSGDADNAEAQGAAYYFKQLQIKRERFGDWPNPAFNYVYALLRSIITRAICEAGLLPFVGIWHKSEYNTFTLADDLIEPFRPLADLFVLEWLEETENAGMPEPEQLTKQIKTKLLQFTQTQAMQANKYRPIALAARLTAISLAKCYGMQRKKLFLPHIN